MCGIAGFLGFHFPFDTLDVAQKMGKSLEHRGPDSNGVWKEDKDGIVLIHQRLSILDLSPHGHQPMSSFCGRYMIVFNGEIYNHLNIRKDLEKDARIDWRGHSDTETILAALTLWGLENTLKQMSGMFALAIWDKKDKKLYLVRDRIGEKPLYYGFIQGNLVFSSELKAFKYFPGFRADINRDALYQYMSLDYIPAPLSIYQNIFKLKPGTYLEWKWNSQIKNQTYWQLSNVAQSARESFFTDEKTAIHAVKTVLEQSVNSQKIADVPLGAFLSGGIDSTCITALMQSQSPQPIQTFTIGFEEQAYDESSYARKVANYLGTEHHDVILKVSDCIHMVPNFAKIYDEPFADSSQIPTFFVSQLSRRQVTVVLSGDGGDELFGGYNRYDLVPRIWKKLNHLPLFARQIIGKCLTLPTHSHYHILNRLLPASYQKSHLGQKAHKMGQRLAGIHDVNDLYVSLLVKDICPEDYLVNEYPFRSTFFQNQMDFIFEDIQDNMMYLDSLYYLADDILTKVDRASMAMSLETRVPFLDPRVIETAWRLPLTMKIRHHQGKWILREILKDYIPNDLINRPKMGFGIPIADWLRHELSPWVEVLLDKQRLTEQNIFDPIKVQKIWREHQTLQRDWSSFIWNICMFQAWYEEYI